MTALAVAVILLSQQSAPAESPEPVRASTLPSGISDSRKVGKTEVTYLFGSVLPPDAEWKPLTNEERLKIYWKNTWANPGTLFRAGSTSAIDHLGNEPPAWEQGAEGYSRRFASRYAAFAIQDTLQAGGAALAGYDVRYFRCSCRGFGPRLGHALKQTFVTKNREGKWRPNWPQWAGGLGGTAIGVYAWYPPSERNVNTIARDGVTQIAFPAIYYLFVEFGPELRRAIRFGR